MSSESDSAGKYVKITKGQNFPLGVCRALLVGTAGAATLIDKDGEEQVDVPLQQGYNPLRAKQVKAGGTADNIWALF